MSEKETSRLRIAVATDEERTAIYRLRHEVYARELGQHQENAAEQLTDPLDEYNLYLTASQEGEIIGFISITPPGSPRYSLDKYVPREELPFLIDEGTYELRLLTLIQPRRGQPVAALLMYAAFRWVEAHDGTRIIAIGRQEVLSNYLKAGLRPLGRQVLSGAVTFEVLTSTTAESRAAVEQYALAARKYEARIDWQLPFPFRQSGVCLHGGESFAALGDEFERLGEREAVINADVLDAWFPPAPGVIAALTEHLPWLLRTSPPTGCEGMIRAIARARGLEPEWILPGGGSSNLIFLALREWLSPDSRALVVDPSYGEYSHILEKVIGCQTDRLPLSREEGYTLDPERLRACFERQYDLIVLVNPNSPTGRHLPRAGLEAVLAQCPDSTRVWIDETYVEYAGPDQSLEKFAGQSRNVVVCKSLSKTYALSGVRAAYLCGPARLMEELRSLTPPWAVSLLGQVATVKALADPDYYARQYAETHRLREELAAALSDLGLEVVPSVANFLLCHLPESGPSAALVRERCQAEGLFLRDAGTISTLLGERAIRIAVKDGPTNQRSLAILARALKGENS